MRDLKYVDHPSKQYRQPELQWAAETTTAYYNIIQSSRSEALQELRLKLENEQQSPQHNVKGKANEHDNNTKRLRLRELVCIAADAGLHIR